MRYETKKGLLKQRPLSISQVYKPTIRNGRSFSVVITNFTSDYVIRDLLFTFIRKLDFKISVKSFENQLKLLEPLTLDEKIRIINNTIENGWNSLSFEYNKLLNKRINYENK